MHIATKLLRSQLQLLRPLLTNEPLQLSRHTQDQAGALIKRRLMASYEHVQLPGFEASWAMPRDITAPGVILYLHGGGYVAGRIKYAEGFGSILAARTGLRTFCAAYRLAPEYPFPAALEDAAAAYRHLLDIGVPAQRIILAGESAGGGLCFCLCLWLKQQGLPQPCGIIAISPWTDLTLQGSSIRENEEGDPLLTLEQLEFFVKCYAQEQDVLNPLISPAYGELCGLPDSLIFAGGDELLLSDARLLQEKLELHQVNSHLFVRPEMWHGYILYGVEEAKEDYAVMTKFIMEKIGDNRSVEDRSCDEDD